MKTPKQIQARYEVLTDSIPFVIVPEFGKVSYVEWLESTVIRAYGEKELLEGLNNDYIKVLGEAKDEISRLRREMSRLRELLERCKDIPFVRIKGEPYRHTADCGYPYTHCKCHLEELLTEIENELNQTKKT